MKTLPRILVVDDLLGRVVKGENRDRSDFCFRLDLADFTGDLPANIPGDAAAAAVFASAQRVEAGIVRNDLAAALGAIAEGWRDGNRWALVLLDLHFKTGVLGVNGEPAGNPGDWDPAEYFGLAILRAAHASTELADVPFVILSSMDRERVERQFSELGALDFVDKSALTRELFEALLQRHGLLEAPGIVGRSLPLLKCLREGRNRARLPNENILVVGETGTGKELLARFLHDSSRRAGRFETLFVSGVPEALVEDRLFGHTRGAFTGATEARPGVAELAEGGTLFIDEFGSISAAVQPKLLRLLDKNIRETQRIGSSESRRLDLLVVMGTQRGEFVAGGEVPGDLLYRAKIGAPLRLPPLRERRPDIGMLVESFMRRLEKNYAAQSREVTEEAMAALSAYHWPGNVRELENTIERAIAEHPGLRFLTVAHLGALAVAPKARIPPDVKVASGTASVAHVLDVLTGFKPESESVAQWAGRFPDFQYECALLLGRLLRAALRATRKHTPQSPSGEAHILSAVRLLTGDSSITGSRAADMVKRILLQAPPAVRDELLEDLLVRQALERATRLRPSSTRNPKVSSRTDSRRRRTVKPRTGESS